MMMPHRLYVGTVGEGVFRSIDNGQTFRRAADGLFVECAVRALVAHPERPGTLYLGSEDGVFLSEDGAGTWRRLPCDLDGLAVWSICLTPGSPDRLVVGTCPARIFHSADGGHTWHESDARIQQGCPRIRHSRVTTIVADPEDRDRLWAGVEIDGVFHSDDGGQTWAPIGTGLLTQDVHALAVIPGGGPGDKRLLATTNRDLHASDDGGKTWRPMQIDSVLPWLYTRGLAQKCGQPGAVLLGGGDAPPGWEGGIALSGDAGQTWSQARLSPGATRANSTVWCFAVYPTNPDLIYAASVSGQVLRSLDGGQTWQKLDREFGEIRALAWTPAA